MKYCEHTTCSHPISIQFGEEVELLNIIFRSEGCTTKLFESEKAINLDKVESAKCRRERRSPQSTMDLTIGISRNERNHQMLLVELKLNVGNPNNISEKEIKAKIQNSINILGQETPINSNKIIIFKDNQSKLAKSLITRLFGHPLRSSIQIKTAKEFLDEYFD